MFNRVDTTPNSISWRPGFSRADSQMDLARLAYQYLFQDHRPWNPNLNREMSLNASCEGEPVVGYNNRFENQWWVVLDKDVEVALMGR